MSTNYPRFEYWKTGSQWYWHLQAANGRIIGASGGFNSEDGVKAAIRTFYQNVLAAGKNDMVEVDGPN